MIFTTKSETDEQDRTWYRVHGRAPLTNQVWEDVIAYANENHANERREDFIRGEYLKRIGQLSR